MADSSSALPARAAMLLLLERAFPGNSDAIRVMREQLLAFVGNPSATSCLLTGPTGVGKSGIARIIAYLKRVAVLKEESAVAMVDAVKFDDSGRMDLRLMDWYRELALTGLTEELAGSQLFGSLKGGFTGAVERPGIFEEASGWKARQPSRGSLVTGGVVFLDEIGDLTPALQAKLLPVLAGGVFYRVGAEGQKQYEIEYRGVLVTATWRRLDGGRMRADLLSRISGYTIAIPSLAERREDLEMICRSVEARVIGRYLAKVEALRIAEPDLDGDYWATRTKSVKPLAADVRRALIRTDWSQHGNLRGLTQAVESLMAGGELDSIIVRLPVLDDSDDQRKAPGEELLARLMERPSNGSGLAAHVNSVQLEQRLALRETLTNNPSARSSLAEALGLDANRFAYQLRQLTRRRVSKGGGA